VIKLKTVPKLISSEFAAIRFNFSIPCMRWMSRSRLIRFPRSGERLPTGPTLAPVRFLHFVSINPFGISKNFSNFTHRSFSPPPFCRLKEHSDAFPCRISPVSFTAQYLNLVPTVFQPLDYIGNAAGVFEFAPPVWVQQHCT